MEISFLVSTDTIVIVSVQFILMMFFIYLGIKVSFFRKVSRDSEESNSIVITGIYTVTGLLLAFSFGMSGSRFDSRKKDIVEEANNIGTAILRSDMYPDSIRSLFREDFRNYLEARILFFEAHDDLNMVKKSIAMSDEYADKLWKRATELSKNSQYLVVSNQMIPALNAVFDIANTRMRGELYKLPDQLIYMLLLSLIIGAFIYGYTSQSKGKVDWFIAICFCLVSIFIIFFILDMDRPRRGLINLDDSHKAITDIRKLFQ